MYYNHITAFYVSYVPCAMNESVSFYLFIIMCIFDIHIQRNQNGSQSINNCSCTIKIWQY